MGWLAAAWEVTRPFTLLMPALGMASGALIAWGASPRVAHHGASTASWVLDVAIGAVAAMLLNAASNVLNQVCDLEIDRINKPRRVLPSGRLSVRAAMGLSAFLYGIALTAAGTINLACFLLFAAAAVATVVYSAPPFRTKRFAWVANATIALPRGVLLPVAGWSVTRSVASWEPWLIGGMLGLFLLGASVTKDFADVEGDRAGGCETLPIRYGREGAIRLAAPFFTVPFLLLAAGAGAGVLTGHRVVLALLGLGCAGWGQRVVGMLRRDPEARVTENHPAWRHMYYLMFTLQAGLVLAYLL